MLKPDQNTINISVERKSSASLSTIHCPEERVERCILLRFENRRKQTCEVYPVSNPSRHRALDRVLSGHPDTELGTGRNQAQDKERQLGLPALPFGEQKKNTIRETRRKRQSERQGDRRRETRRRRSVRVTRTTTSRRKRPSSTVPTNVLLPT